LSLEQSIKASFTYFLLALMMLACRKEEPVYPSLNLDRQGLSSSYRYKDTLRLNFRASNASSYQIRVLQGARVFPVAQRLIYQDGSDFEVELYFNDPYFPTGNYDLRIQAFNGENGVSTFFEFSYQELALGYRGYALLGATKLSIEDDNGVKTDYPLNKAYDQVMVSSRDSLVYLAAYRDENLAVYDLKDLSFLSDFPLPAPVGSKSYHDFIKTDRGLFALQTDGDIKYYQGGTVLNAISVDNGLGIQARTGAWLGNRLAAVLSTPSGANPELVVFNSDLNGILSSYPLNDPNADLVKLEEDVVGVFETINGQLRFSTYTISTGIFDLEFSAAIGPVREACYANTSPDVDLLLFATDTNFYSYQLASLNPPSLDQNIAPKNFRFDRLAEVLFLQNGNFVQVYVSPGNLSFATSFSGSLKDFDILYNK